MRKDKNDSICRRDGKPETGFAPPGTAFNSSGSSDKRTTIECFFYDFENTSHG